MNRLRFVVVNALALVAFIASVLYTVGTVLLAAAGD